MTVKRKQLEPNYLENSIIMVNFFVHLSNLHHISNILKKRDEPHSRCISEIKDCKNCGYLIAKKAPCLNNYGQSTCYSVRNNDEICTAVVLSRFLITLKERQLEKFFLSTI